MIQPVSIRDRVAAVFSHPGVAQAFHFLKDNEGLIEKDQIRLTMIPAPPFGEEARGRAFADELRQSGFSPATDEIGNIVSPYSEAGANPVVLGAHLDTVFPGDVLLKPRKNGRVTYLPGLSDNGAGLVAVLWVFRAALHAGLRFRRPVIVVGNVGEEGEGNLRGVRRCSNLRRGG